MFDILDDILRDTSLCHTALSLSLEDLSRTVTAHLRSNWVGSYCKVVLSPLKTGKRSAETMLTIIRIQAQLLRLLSFAVLKYYEVEEKASIGELPSRV